LLAQCSAYMEGIEHYYAESIVIKKKSAYVKLKNKEAIHPERFSRGSLFCEDLGLVEFNWSEVFSLTNEDKKLIPAEILHFDLTDSRSNSAYFNKTSTGLASGNTYLEAVMHALFEIIERNALWCFAQCDLHEKKQRTLDVNTINSPEIKKIIDSLQAKRIQLLFYDVMNDFGVPAFQCIISDEYSVRQVGNFSGSGAHFDKEVALLRALTEAVQSRLTYISGSRDDVLPGQYQRVWSKLSSAKNKDFAAIDSVIFHSFDDIFKKLKNIFGANGYEALCYRHTNEGDAISVVHCVVPDLPL